MFTRRALLFFAFLSFPIFAEPEAEKILLYPSISPLRDGEIRNVRLIKTELRKPLNSYEAYRVIFHLEIEANLQSETAHSLEHQLSRSQAAIDAPMNPSDHYFALKVMPSHRGALAGGWLNLKKFVFEWEESIPTDRVTGEPIPARTQEERTRYFSFTAGMGGGQHMWRLFRLNFFDLAAPTWEFKKHYVYSQGQAVDLGHCNDALMRDGSGI
jgi:hypothetical protein